VPGVFVGPEEGGFHIGVSSPPPEPIPALAERVRERAASGAGGRAMTVVVEDLEVVRDENL